MPRRPEPASMAVALLALGTLAAGCGGGDGEVKCSSGLMAGDLVITEVMANPEGPDEGQEWFEVFNPTTASLDLSGLTLEAAKGDGTSETTHKVRAGVAIEAGQYMVFGGTLEEVKPDWVDYAYGADLGSLRNNGGRLRLKCAEALVDQVVYLDTAEGASLSFDGAITPDAVANDDIDSWCESETPFAQDSYGTPGTANEACGGVLPPTKCMDGDQERDVVAPQPGDVVITEIMPNPDAVDDGDGEWFEVYVGADFDLNGLKVSTEAEAWQDQVVALDCVPVTAGSYLVFAVNADPEVNGGLPVVDQVVDVSLTNSDGLLRLGYGEQVLDGISWGSASAGVSSALEPSLTDPDHNDDQQYWCAGETPYGDGDLGSPGAANASCGISPEGQCFEDGALRDSVPPQPGELIITEFMPDPDAVADADGEWFELYVAADVDLNRLQVGKTVGEVEFSLPGGDCLPVAAGTHVVFAAELDPALNGGLPRADYRLEMSLSNSGDQGIFVGYGDTVIDAIAYSSSHTGAATALEPQLRDAELNDNPDYWCAAESVYGDGDLGTPGAANDACGIAPEGQCYDGQGALRDLVPPQPGDIVITEFMPDPDAANDSDGEWIELYVGADVDLNGLDIGKADGGVEFSLPSGDCLPAAAGSWVVLAASDDPALNGNLPQVDFLLDMSLVNGGDGISVALAGQLLDEVIYSGSTTGAATSLDPAFRTPADNDTEDNWCPAQAAYGDGDLGTPGGANPACP